MVLPYQIITAEKKYIEQIVSVASSYQIDKQTENEINKSGFLVSNYNHKEYLSYLNYVDYFYLCMLDGNVAGFILAYADYNIKDNEWLNKKIQAFETEPFVLIKQICVSKKYGGKGIGKKLYEHLFVQTKQSICCAVIVVEPLNQPSIIFHEKLGFKKQFEDTPPDGLKRSVWKRISS